MLKTCYRFELLTNLIFFRQKKKASAHLAQNQSFRKILSLFWLSYCNIVAFIFIFALINSC